MRKIAMKEIASDTDLASAAKEFTRKYGKSLNTVIEGLREAPEIKARYKEHKDSGWIDTGVPAHDIIKQAFETVTDTRNPRKFDREYSYKDQVSDIQSDSAANKDTLGERLKDFETRLYQKVEALPVLKTDDPLSGSDLKLVSALRELRVLNDSGFIKDYKDLQSRIDVEADKAEQARNDAEANDKVTKTNHAAKRLAELLKPSSVRKI